jgi:hypothetical protein
MKTTYITSDSMFSGSTSNGIDFDNTYDYALFSKDWAGQEVTYFNLDEMEEVLSMIENREIRMHHSYSVLYCKDERSYNNLSKTAFACFSTIF